MGKAKMAISEISIPQGSIVATGDGVWGRIGHEFKLKVTLDVSKRTLGRVSGEGIDCPELEWRETVDWYELTPPNTWLYAPDSRNGQTRDLFPVMPSSNTFRPWAQARYFVASDPSNHPPAELTAAVNSNGKHAELEEMDKLAKHWIANNGFAWTISITDRPALGLSPGPGSHGGGVESLVKSNSRRRVLYFDLGFKGRGPRVTATQVLETIQGRPTIHKFFVPAISKSVADDEQKLARWRLDVGQPDQTTVL